MLSGFLGGVWAFLRSASSKPGKVPLGLIAGVGAALLIYGGLLLSFYVADKVVAVRGDLGIAILLFFTIIYGWFVNLSYVSIHRMYRDRLMEAFLPDPEPSQIAKPAPAAIEADGAVMHGIWDHDKPNGPYPLVNTNVILVNSSDRTRKSRGGDNFILSPLYCGSAASGWLRTDRFMQGKLTLATAMAISGAAANPNTGVAGKGATRGRALSLLMSILGISLGHWVAGPHVGAHGIRRPNHFWPGLYVLLANGFRRSRDYLMLSDGGHFENLGLYELIRRRMRLIVLCDGGQDNEYRFADFEALIRRVEADFGATIRFEPSQHLEHLMPKDDAGYPPGTKVAKRGYIVGTIRYCNGVKGVLIYLKTTTIAKLSLKTKGYQADHPDFPDQPTADQFFDEEQFEAYRELGYRIAEQMIDEVSGTDVGIYGQGLASIIHEIEDGTLDRG